MAQKISKQKILCNSYEIRKEIHNNRKYIVVPVVMMVEGVHSGSRGATLHTQQELGNNPQIWNGIPIVVGHPQDNENNYISANSPNVQKVGVVYNTMFDGKLKAEAWLDEQKLIACSPTALQYINEKRALDVSVGVYTDEIVQEGDWNDEHYHIIASNYKPDHLALLPGEEGACNWADGCGIRVNKKENDIEDLKKQIKEGDIVVNGLVNNKQGYRELINTIQNYLDGKDTPDTYNYLEEVYNNYFIYKKQTKSEGAVYYKQKYKVNSDNTFEEIDSPMEVQKKISYININKEKSKMAENNCETTVLALIANEHTRFQNEDKEWLMALSAEQIAKLNPLPQRTKTPEAEPEPLQLNNEMVIDFMAEKSDEEILKLIPSKMAVNVKKQMEAQKKQKEDVINSIMTNAKDIWKKEDLEVMSVETLDKINTPYKQVDYSATSISSNAKTNNDEDLLIPMEVELENKKN